MKSRFRYLSGSLLLLAAIIGFRIAGKSPQMPAGHALPPAPATSTKTQPLPAETSRPARNENQRILSDWSDLKRWLASDPAPGDEQVRERLLALRTSWAAMDPHTLANTIGSLLATGDDMKTGLLFETGPHGLLNGWPTLRVFLLDVLALSDPELAATIARGILDQTQSANEYAVALRSLTREGMGRADDSELISRFGNMLARSDWQRERGFAEAFDMARFLGSSEAARSLADWPGNPKLKAMALHEFAAEHPDKIIPIAASGAGIDPAHRAYLMARAQPSDPGQAAAVETYLHDPNTTAGEAARFLKAYPFRGATTGYRLYGRTPAPFSKSKITADDRAAFEQAGRWLNDPALQANRTEILALQSRLAEWIEQGK